MTTNSVVKQIQEMSRSQSALFSSYAHMMDQIRLGSWTVVKLATRFVGFSR